MGKYNGRIKVKDTLKIGDTYKFVDSEKNPVSFVYHGVDPDGLHTFYDTINLCTEKTSDPCIINKNCGDDEHRMVDDIGTYIEYMAITNKGSVTIELSIHYSYEGMNEQTFHFDQLARQVLANTKPYRPKS